MSVWGPGFFENDDAAAYVADLEKSSGFDLLRAALDVPADPTEFVSIEEIRRALVAAEVIAALKGDESGVMPDALVAWMQGLDGFEVDPVDLRFASQSVKRALRHSEARESWSRLADANEWIDNVKFLLTRLG
jgi:hypothetical protein